MPCRYPHFQKCEFKRQVCQMLDTQLIQKSHSQFSSLILLVKKKDGVWRFCVDYHALNAITIKDKFLIPTVDELFDELGGSHFFSKLDLLAGYHQISVRPDDVPKTEFCTHECHYEFCIFRPYLRKFVLIFLDDILVFSSDWSTHLQHVQEVLEVLQEHGFVAKSSSWVFGQQSIEYLDYVVSLEGLDVNPNKVTSIQAWPELTNVKEVRVFLSLAGCYR
ncbi:hypothetical protein GQ457_05G020200 [Hibiscus cannabinus]